MALNWDLTKIENVGEVCWVKDDEGKEKMSPITEVLIWGTILAGIGDWTEKNIEEVIVRLKLIEKTQSALLTQDGKPRFLTEAEIRAHIGMRTNVSTETKATFHARLCRVLRQNVMQELRMEREKEVKIA